MSLGEKISSLRKSKGISQEKLAENAKVSLRTIQRIEAGDSIPRPYTLKVIADALEVTIDQLTLFENENISASNALDNLRLINLCGLIAFFPLLNILLPLMVWKKHKHLPLVNALGRRIISFQILWTLVVVLALALTRILQVGIKGSVAIGRLPPSILVVYLLLVAVNLIVVVRQAVYLKENPSSIYLFVPVLL